MTKTTAKPKAAARLAGQKPVRARSSAAPRTGPTTRPAAQATRNIATCAQSTGKPDANSTRVLTRPSAPPTDTVLAQLAALKDMPTPALKAKWRDLFESAPPPYNRRFLESRLAYRIQELAYGGLKPETVARLRALGEELDGGNISVRKQRVDPRPIAGTRLIRQWQGVEHTVTVRADDYDYVGRPYKSLSAVARHITGTRWNGWVFFGLKSGRGRQ
jgi:hypothetical protein